MNRFLHTHRRRVVAASAASIAGVGLLLTGVASAASPGPTTNSGPTTSSGPTTNSGPTTSSTPSGAAAPSTTGGQAAGQVAGALKEIRTQLKAGVTHGDVTVTTKKGSKTVNFERGTVQLATATSFEVTDASGTTQTWVVGPKMKVRERGQRKAGASPSSSAAVVNGESVIVVGAQTGSTSTARLVVVLPATKRGTKTQGTTT